MMGKKIDWTLDIIDLTILTIIILLIGAIAFLVSNMGKGGIS
jgi:hypothetical protein